MVGLAHESIFCFWVDSPFTLYVVRSDMREQITFDIYLTFKPGRGKKKTTDEFFFPHTNTALKNIYIYIYCNDALLIFGV